MIDIDTQLDLFKLISRSISKDIIAYAFGGTAMMFYGYKTATKDIDLLFETKEEFNDFIKAIENLGYSKLHLKAAYSKEKQQQKGKPIGGFPFCVPRAGTARCSHSPVTCRGERPEDRRPRHARDRLGECPSLRPRIIRPACGRPTRTPPLPLGQSGSRPAPGYDRGPVLRSMRGGLALTRHGASRTRRWPSGLRLNWLGICCARRLARRVDGVYTEA